MDKKEFIDFIWSYASKTVKRCEVGRFYVENSNLITEINDSIKNLSKEDKIEIIKHFADMDIGFSWFGRDDIGRLTVGLIDAEELQNAFLCMGVPLDEVWPEDDTLTSAMEYENQQHRQESNLDDLF